MLKNPVVENQQVTHKYARFDGDKFVICCLQFSSDIAIGGRAGLCILLAYPCPHGGLTIGVKRTTTGGLIKLHPHWAVIALAQLPRAEPLHVDRTRPDEDACSSEYFCFQNYPFMFPRECPLISMPYSVTEYIKEYIVPLSSKYLIREIISLENLRSVD